MNSIFNIKHNDDNTRTVEIDIIGNIGADWLADDDSNTLQSLNERLQAVNAIDADSIIVNINSLGGDVDQALAIYETLRKFDTRIETNMIGFCASAATIIAMAGHKRRMSRYSVMLIHQCSSYAMGNTNDLKREIEVQQTINDTIAKLYADRTGQDITTIIDLMNENDGQGRWLMYGEALDKGFITGELDSPKTKQNYTRSEIYAAGLPQPPHRLTRYINNLIINKMIQTTTEEPRPEQEALTVGATAAQQTPVQETAEPDNTIVSIAKNDLEAMQNRIAELERMIENAPAVSTNLNGSDETVAETFADRYSRLKYVQDAIESIGIDK